MSTNSTYSKNITLAAPTQGMDFESPLGAMNPLTATWLQDCYCDSQLIKIRGGFEIEETIPTDPATTVKIMALGVSRSTSDLVFAAVRNTVGAAERIRVYNALTGGFLLDYGDASTTWQAASTTFSGYFQFQFSDPVTGTGNALYNPVTGTWSTTGINAAGVIRPFTYYKGRPYQATGTILSGSLSFGTLGQITGNLASNFPVQNVFTLSSGISFLTSFSTGDGQQNQDYLVIGNYLGEILVYSGDYPGSTSWTLVGRFFIGKLLGITRTVPIPIQSDVYIPSVNGLFSLRDLITRGNTFAIQNSPTKKITKYWSDLFRTYSDVGSNYSREVSAAYDPKTQRLFVLYYKFANLSGQFESNTASILVCNIETFAWTVFKINIPSSTTYGPGNIVLANNEIYFAIDDKVIHYNESLFADERLEFPGDYQGYTAEIYGAHQVYNDAFSVTKATAFQPIINTDIEYLSVKLQSDFGRAETSNTIPPLLDGFQKPFCSVGIEGTYFRYAMSATTIVDPQTGAPTLDVGFDFYATSITYEKGGSIS